MIRARAPGAAPAIQGSAESLPFADGSFDAAMAILTVHHWPDQDRGLAELRRVADRRIVLTFDPDFADAMWLIRDYFPSNAEIDRQQFRPIADVAAALGDGQIHVVEIPHDCTDGFLCAYWRRPEAYLDPRVRAGISSFARMSPAEVERGVAALRDDLATGVFWDRNADLNLNGVRTMIKIVAEIGGQKEPLAQPAKYIDQSYLKQAFAELSKK